MRGAEKGRCSLRNEEENVVDTYQTIMRHRGGEKGFVNI